MSAPAQGWVMLRSPLTGVAYTVHLLLGDLANDQNRNEVWMSQEKLAHRARTTRQTVNKVLAEMVNTGLLEAVTMSASGTTRFRLIMDDSRYPVREEPEPKTPRTAKGVIPPPPPPPPPKVSPLVTPEARSQVSPLAIEVSPLVAEGVASGDTELKRTQTTQTRTFATDKPSPKGSRSKSPKFTPPADRLARAEWERRTIKPVCGFMVMRTRIDEVLAAGHSEADVERVLPEMAAFSRNAFDHMLGQAKGRGRGGLRSVPEPSSDRETPDGIVVL